MAKRERRAPSEQECDHSITPRQAALADPWLSEADAAEYLDYAVKTLRNRRYNMLPPRYGKTASGIVRYKLSALDEFLAEDSAS